MSGKLEKEGCEDRLAAKLVDLLVAEFKKRAEPEPSPWITAKQGAERANCAPRMIYAAVQQKKLRAARVGAGRSMRFRAAWVDQWLDESAPKED